MEKTITKLEDIEKNLWRKNVKKEARNNKDFLDTKNEDFSMNKSLSIEGKEITPSSNASLPLIQRSLQHI